MIEYLNKSNIAKNQTLKCKLKSLYSLVVNILSNISCIVRNKNLYILSLNYVRIYMHHMRVPKN